MKKIFKQTVQIIFVFSVLLWTVACEDENSGIKLSDYTISVILPEDMSNADPSGVKVELINVNTGTGSTFYTDNRGVVSFTNLEGVYSVRVSGKKTYTFLNNDGTTVERTSSFAGLSENLVFTEKTSSHAINTHIQVESKGWVIKEIYSAGTKTPNGGSYYKDQFIEIYNNTDSIMYADGLTIGETRHQTSLGENVYADDMQQKTFLWTVYRIEGNAGTGKEFPVEPGKSIVIAPQPIDHRGNGSIDLSRVSDFQWYDKYGNSSIDVPSVPNLKRYYSHSLSIWVVTVQMNRGFVIFKIPQGEDMTLFVQDNTDVRLNNAGTEVIAIRVPNEYIYDAVELGNKDKFYMKSLSSSLDIGFAYTQETYNGKSIRRKIERIEPDGRIVYKDTNNSSFDFWTSRTPAPKQFPTDDEMSHE